MVWRIFVFSPYTGEKVSVRRIIISSVVSIGGGLLLTLWGGFPLLFEELRIVLAWIVPLVLVIIWNALQYLLGKDRPELTNAERLWVGVVFLSICVVFLVVGSMGSIPSEKKGDLNEYDRWLTEEETIDWIADRLLAEREGDVSKALIRRAIWWAEGWDSIYAEYTCEGASSVNDASVTWTWTRRKGIEQVFNSDPLFYDGEASFSELTGCMIRFWSPSIIVADWKRWERFDVSFPPIPDS